MLAERDVAPVKRLLHVPVHSVIELGNLVKVGALLEGFEEFGKENQGFAGAEVVEALVLHDLWRVDLGLVAADNQR